MFQFPGFPPYLKDRVTEHYPCWVSPFGYPRIKTCLRFPVAFRSLLRPSSALGAKASTVCPYYLDFFSSVTLGRVPKEHSVYVALLVASSYAVVKVHLREKNSSLKTEQRVRYSRDRSRVYLEAP